MCKVRQKTEHSSEAQSVASDHHSGTINIIAIYMVSTVSDLLHSSETIFFFCFVGPFSPEEDPSPFMDSDCCLQVEHVCCDYWGFSFSHNHLYWGQENSVNLGLYTYFLWPLLFWPAQHKAIRLSWFVTLTAKARNYVIFRSSLVEH